MPLDFPEFSGRHGDEIDMFCLFVDQLEAAVDALKTGRLALQRMSLVALDNLADILLQEFVEQLFFTSDELGLLPGQRFNRTSRQRIEGDFRKRVALASKQPDPAALFYPRPILDAQDAAIFRVAHRYRNDVYHANRHNRALMEPLAQLFAQAVGRAFVRSNPEGTSMGGGIKDRLTQLDRFDWRDDPGRDLFVPHEAARRIVEQVCAFPDIAPDELSGKLRDDVEQRCSLLAEELDGLKEDGLDDVQVEALLESVQLWAADRGDEQAVKLEEERRDIFQAVLEAEGWDEDRRSALKAVERAQLERMMALQRDFEFPLHIEDIKDAQDSGSRLTAISSEVDIVNEYRLLDDRVAQLESAVDWMLITWDRHLQSESDRMRGKYTAGQHGSRGRPR